MPQIRHDPPHDAVVRAPRPVQNPLPQRHILLPGMPQSAAPRHRKLRAALRAHGVVPRRPHGRGWPARSRPRRAEDTAQRVREGHVRDDAAVPGLEHAAQARLQAGLRSGVGGVAGAGGVGAAEVVVAGGLQRGGEVEGLEEGQVVVGGVVVVPGEAGGVDEDHAGGGEGVVVVDQEGEVGGCFVGGVGWDGEMGGVVGERVDGVDAGVVFGCEGGEPCCVFCGGAGDDEGGFGGGAEGGAFAAGGW